MVNIRKQNIDNFLKYLCDLITQNPGLTLNSNSIYHELTRLNIPNSERTTKIDSNFRFWKVLGAGFFVNCKVFVQENWNYFCQFVSHDLKAYNSHEHLKVYIPLDAQHIKYGAVEIFKFLDNENISHCSKIGSDVRFDDIVIRLIDPNDVIKLVNFISSNEFIQEGLIPPNPFLFNVNGIAMAVDGHLSFNMTIANLIKLYIQEKQRTNTLNQVSADDFYNYVQLYINKAFSNSESLKKISTDFEDGTQLSTEELVNYKNVFELIIKCTSDDFSFQNYVQHYMDCTNPYMQNQKFEQIEKIKSISSASVNFQQTQHQDYIATEKDTILTTMEILKIMSKKYGKTSAYYSLEDFILTGDPCLLTRTDNLRERIVNSSYRNDVQNILSSRNISLSDFLHSAASSVVTPGEMFLEQAVLETYSKYETKFQEGSCHISGREFVIGSIIKLITTKQYDGFTRDNNARDNLQRNVTVQEIIDIIQKQIGIDNANRKQITYDDIVQLATQYTDLIIIINNNLNKTL